VAVAVAVAVAINMAIFSKFALSTSVLAFVADASFFMSKHNSKKQEMSVQGQSTGGSDDSSDSSEGSFHAMTDAEEDCNACIDFGDFDASECCRTTGNCAANVVGRTVGCVCLPILIPVCCLDMQLRPERYAFDSLDYNNKAKRAQMQERLGTPWILRRLSRVDAKYRKGRSSIARSRPFENMSVNVSDDCYNAEDVLPHYRSSIEKQKGTNQGSDSTSQDAENKNAVLRD